jgi:hypothetical protein
MRFFKSALATGLAALALAGPAWADGGHGRERGRHGSDHGWRDGRHGSDWRYQGHYRRHGWHPRQRQHSYRYNYYYPPYPAYGYAAPPPGVHIVVPNIYIPLR